MPNDFSSRSGNVLPNLRLAMIDQLGRTQAIDDSKSLGLEFATLSLEAYTSALSLSASGATQNIEYFATGIHNFSGAPIEVGSGYASSGATLTQGGALSLKGALVVDSTSWLKGDVTIGDGYASNGASWTAASGSLSMKGDLVVDGNATLGNASTDAHTFNGDITHIGNYTQTGDMTITGNLRVVGDVVQEDSVNVRFEDAMLELGVDLTNGTHSSATDLGFRFAYNDGSDKWASFYRDATVDPGRFKLVADISGPAFADLQIKDLFGVNATLTGNLQVDGNSIIGSDSADDVAVNARITTSLIPKADSTSDLGSALLGWKDVYADKVLFTANGTQTGESEIVVEPALADALSITDGTQDFIVIDSDTPKVIITPELDIQGASVQTAFTEHSIMHIGANGYLEEDTAFRYDSTHFMISGTDQASSKFNVEVASGNTIVKGTLDVDGAGEFNSTLGADGSFRVGASGASNFTVDSANGNTVVEGTLDVNSTSTFANVISLDAASAADRKIQSSGALLGSMYIQSEKYMEIKSTTGNVVVQSVTGSSEFSAYGLVDIKSTDSKSIQLDNLMFQELAGVPAERGMAKELILDGEMIASLVKDYEKASGSLGPAHYAGPVEMVKVEEFLGLKAVAQQPAFDHSEQRELGSAYTYPTQRSLILSGDWVAGASFEINGNTYDQATYSTIAALSAQLSADGVLNFVEPSGDLAIDALIENEINLTNGAVNQPELYFEDVKIVKWTGDRYAMSNDLQGAYDSSSADFDIPSIVMDDNYDFSIELGQFSQFKVETQISQTERMEISVKEDDLRYSHTQLQTEVALLKGDVLALDNTGKLIKADKSSSENVIGVCAEDVNGTPAQPERVKIHMMGTVIEKSAHGGAPGEEMFLGSAGAVVKASALASVSGDMIFSVGYAISADFIMLMPRFVALVP